MTEPAPIATSTFGVLNYKLYSETYLPLVERLRRSDGRTALDDLRGFVAAIDDKDGREDATAQLERIEGAVGGGRWHRNAAGLILEAACVESAVRLSDMLPTFQASIEFLYQWNEGHAETIHTFFAFLGDRTVPWASPAEAWRAMLPPADIAQPTEAMAALSGRDLRKLLEEAENGDVFSPEEARDVSEWWSEVRKVVRLAHRMEQGLFVSVRHPV